MTTLAALDTAFDKVDLLPPAYAFGKGGYTNVQKGQITKAIDDFITPACNFPSLTIEERHVLILALVWRWRVRNGKRTKTNKYPLLENEQKQISIHSL